MLPEFAASSGIDTKMPWIETRLYFPAEMWMQAHISSPIMKGCLNPWWRHYRKPSVNTSSLNEASHPFDNSRGMRSSMLQKERMPDSTWKLIVNPIYLWQLQKDSGSPESPQEATLLSCHTSRRIMNCPSQLDRSPDVAEHIWILTGQPGRYVRI